MTRLPRIACAWLLAVAATCASAEVELRARTEEPRAFGHQVGDLVTRVVLIDLPEGLSLDAESLPAAGRVGPALELRAIARSERRIAGGRELRLALEFQVMASPVTARVFDLPTLKLRIDGRGGSQELRVDPWPLAVSPVGPEDASPRRGLGELRPDAPPPPADTRRLRAVVSVALAVAAGIGAWLAVIHFGLPWWSRRRRPFGLAWRELQSWKRRGQLRDDAESLRTAVRRLHAALDATAGRALFASAVDDFLAVHPRYAPLRGELLRFFESSRSAFFSSTPAPADTEMRWLLDLARSLRDAERGSA